MEHHPNSITPITLTLDLILGLTLADRRDERTLTHMSDGSVQVGHDPSRKDLLGYTTDYWVSTDKLRTWLADWDAWEAAKPAWFLMKNRAFEKRMMKYAPTEALP